MLSCSVNNHNGEWNIGAPKQEAKDHLWEQGPAYAPLTAAKFSWIPWKSSDNSLSVESAMEGVPPCLNGHRHVVGVGETLYSGPSLFHSSLGSKRIAVGKCSVSGNGSAWSWKGPWVITSVDQQEVSWEKCPFVNAMAFLLTVTFTAPNQYNQNFGLRFLTWGN